MSTISARTRETLQESVRNIHHMAGIAIGSGSANQPFVIGVTSPNRKDGKTTFAMALASSLADDLGSPVTLVDADLRTHSLEREYGLIGEYGLSEVMTGETSMDNVRHTVPRTTLSVVAAGMTPSEAERRIRSDAATGFMASLKESSRYVILDLPAVLNASSAPVMAGLCEGVIVVVRRGRTTRGELETALERLNGANVLGVVFNRSETRIPWWLQKLLALKP